MGFFCAALRHSATRGVTVCGRWRGGFAGLGGGCRLGIHELVAINENRWRARLVDGDRGLGNRYADRQHRDKGQTNSPPSCKKAQMVVQHGRGFLVKL